MTATAPHLLPWRISGQQLRALVGVCKLVPHCIVLYSQYGPYGILTSRIAS